MELSEQESIRESKTTFVRFSDNVRTLLIIVALALILIKGVLYGVGDTEGWGLIYLTSTLITLLYLFPLIAFKESYGWLHILIIFFIRHLISEFTSLGYVGAPHQAHQVLEGWGQAELAWVYVKKNMLYIIAIVSTYVGYFLFSKKSGKKYNFKEFSGFQFKLTIVVLVSVAVFFVFMSTQGGISNWLVFYWGGGRSRAVEAGEVAPGLWMIFVRLAVFGVLFWFAQDPKCLLKPKFWIYAGISMMMVFLITGSRSTVLGFAVYALLIWMMREKKVTPFRFVLFGLVAVVVVSVLGEFRRSTWSGEADWSSFSEIDLTERFQLGIDEVNTRSVSKNGEIAIIALFPNEMEMLYGESYLVLLTAPIPRAIFPSKPQGAGHKLGSELFGIRGGVPAGALGEAYWNGHIFGIILVYILYGVFYRWFINVFQENPDQPTLWLIYAVLIYVFKNPAILGLIYILQQGVSILFLYWLFSFRRNR